MKSTLNARSPSAPYEIVYPFTVSGRPDAQALPLADVVIEHDRDTDLVHAHSSSHDLPILPLHLGMSSRFALPPAGCFLDRVFGCDYLPLTNRSPLLNAADAPRLPRVEVGRVVLQRARWSMPAGAVPVREPGHDDAGHLLRLTAWRRAEGIPEHCFATFRPADRSAGAKSFKPTYVDFANLYLLLDFERQCRTSRSVVLQEALPDFTEALGPDPADPRVTEFLVELSDGERTDG